MEIAPTALYDLFACWQAEFGELDGVILPSEVGGVPAEYEAARGGTALFDGGDRGWIEMAGPDSRDFLQRILTSDLSKLAPGGGQWSALLEGKGKWITDLLLFRFEREGEERFALDLPACRASALHDALDRFHFSERLNWDRIEMPRLLIAGPKAPALLAACGVKAPGPPESGGGGVHGTFAAKTEGDLLLLRRPDRGVPCWEALGPLDKIEPLGRALKQKGAVPAGSATLDVLRVESFLPRYGTDFDGETTLPEANEWRRASVSKGCYTGQEVVAKINTYGEAPWQLCRLFFEDGSRPMHAAELTDADGKAVGRVTSWSHPPGAPCPVGLAMLRRKAAVNGNVLQAVLGDHRTTATVRVPDKVLG